MTDDTHKPSLSSALLVGIMLTTALIAVIYLASQLVGTPFVPFDMFDFVGRVLPGAIITFGIDTIVNTITTFNLGETSSAAKTAEQFLAVSGMFVTGVVGVTVLFWILNRVKVESRLMPGLLLGLIIGVPVMLISAGVNLTATTDPFISSVWIILAFILWGLAAAWAYFRLSDLGVNAKNDMPASVQQLDRRRFLISMGGATAAITVVGTGIGLALQEGNPSSQSVALNDADSVEPRWSETNPLPNADAAVAPAPGTRLEYTPLDEHYRIDINTLPPVVHEDEWTLQFSGLVDKPTDFTLADIRSNYEPLDQFVTLACISNRVGGDLIGTTRWTGVSMQKILADVKPSATATHLKITSADNFDEYVSLDLIKNDERIMLAYAWDGVPLQVKHGFPLRIYIPDHYGMKQPKWISTIEAVESWQPGWWVRRGWDEAAIMRATSVIDTVAVDAVIAGQGTEKLVPVGGIAHAGSRGISKVEVSVDGGNWVEAELRTPMSETTWVIWRYDWPFQSGTHTFSVRCVDGMGTPQIELDASPRPSGATGINSVAQTI